MSIRQQVIDIIRKTVELEGEAIKHIRDTIKLFRKQEKAYNLLLVWCEDLSSILTEQQLRTLANKIAIVPEDLWVKATKNKALFVALAKVLAYNTWPCNNKILRIFRHGNVSKWARIMMELRKYGITPSITIEDLIRCVQDILPRYVLDEAMKIAQSLRNRYSNIRVLVAAIIHHVATKHNIPIQLYRIAKIYGVSELSIRNTQRKLGLR